MRSAMKTVEAFYDALSRKDVKALRGLLAPDFTFKGPLMTFSDPESYVAAMTRLQKGGTISSSKLSYDSELFPMPGAQG